MNELESAILSFRQGAPVLIYDFDYRENEVDIFLPGTSASVATIKRMREISKNSLNAIIPYDFAKRVGFVLLNQLYKEIHHPGIQEDQGKAYPPNFTFPIDHKGCHSGITYSDIALALNSLSEAYRDVVISNSSNALDILSKNFRIPGHMPVIISADRLLEDRQGHTELGMALAKWASITPILAASELLDPENGEPLGLEKAMEISNKENIPLISGSEILKFWQHSATAV